MAATLKVENLSKKYAKVEGAKQVSFEIERGEVFALIGPNGAGKTTTIRMIATLLTPTGGDAFVEGHSVVREPGKVRERITYLPDEAGAYKNMTGRNYLKFMAALFTNDKREQGEAVGRAVEIAALGQRLDDKIASYSRGMIRKLLLARAVMTHPALAMLDEPTSGLDILNALEIRRMIRRLADEEGMSFLISSHNMLEIESLSDRVGIINQGRLLVTGRPDDLKNQFNADNLEEVFERAVEQE
ncbi:MAG: ABC transporter ATP-binding protein [Oscillospiraceae bacterium]|nr:ABC transporter ATP-binding protein [Oscillospiraceae bacterium]